MERQLLVFVLLAGAAMATVKISAKYDDDSKQSITYRPKQQFTLVCNVSSSDESKYIVDWLKDGKPVSEIEEIRSRVKATPSASEPRVSETRATLVISGAIMDDAGNYTCVVRPEGSEDASLTEAIFRVSSTAAVKVPANVNVAESETLTIQCWAKGNPLPTITWVIGNHTYEQSEGRVTLEEFTYEDKPIANGRLVLKDVLLDDEGQYTCVGTDIFGNVDNSTTTVRVNGKYAALWPFLGICAEVIVLCAIIVIYEKKRNKTELEESDTDQSPDQKNTPDHGKDANLRHRQ